MQQSAVGLDGRHYGQCFRDLVQIIRKTREELDLAVERLTEEHNQELARLEYQAEPLRPSHWSHVSERRTLSFEVLDQAPDGGRTSSISRNDLPESNIHDLDGPSSSSSRKDSIEHPSPLRRPRGTFLPPCPGDGALPQNPGDGANATVADAPQADQAADRSRRAVSVVFDKEHEVFSVPDQEVVSVPLGKPSSISSASELFGREGRDTEVFQELANGSRAKNSSAQKIPFKSTMTLLGFQLELREVWKQQPTSKSTKKPTGTMSQRGHTVRISDNASEVTGCWLERCMVKSIIAPSNTLRVLWDAFGAFLVACDMIAIPLQVFDPPRNVLLTALNWTTLLFWTVDMFYTFFVGYPYQGKIEMSPRSIALHYLVTWFVLDAVLVVGDWCTTISAAVQDDNTSENDVSGFGKTLRVLRGLRVLRLLRLLKLKRLMAELEEMVDSEYIQLLVSLVKLVLAVLFMNHAVACLWFLVGSTGDQAEVHWVMYHDVQDDDIIYQYMLSLHWALTQFTPATQNIHPHNFRERALATVIVVLALVTFSTFLSSITATMTQLRNVGADESKQFNLLRRYLNQQAVRTELRRRVVKYLEYAYATRRHCIRESNVSVIALLSDPLRDELGHARSTPNLSAHPFLAKVNRNFTSLMQRVSRSAFAHTYYAVGDGIFHHGDLAANTYFLSVGDVDYHQPNKVPLMSALAIHDWAAEAALWGIWHYVGDMISSTESEVMSIDSTKFGQVMSTNLDVLKIASDYAIVFTRALGQMGPNECSDILQKDFTAHTLKSVDSELWMA